MTSRNRTVLMRALRIMGGALEFSKKQIRPGKSERSVAELLKKYMRKGGYASPAFDFIIATGEKAYFPHHVSNKRLIQKGDMVVVDFGVRTRVGCTDITRTFFLGEPDAKGQRPSSQAIAERLDWWAELFEPPCVGFAASLEEAYDFAAAGADFVLVGDLVWADPRGPKAALVEVDTAIKKAHAAATAGHDPASQEHGSRPA